MTEQALTPRRPDALALAGQVADQAAARHVFADYRDRKAPNTLRRQGADLALFAEYLGDVGVVDVGDLAHDPVSWRGVTWGLVAGFVQWQLRRGYAVSSANVRLSSVKVYCRLAHQAGALDATAYALIQTVKGYSHKEARHLDERREEAEIPTRLGHKKAEPKSINPEQAEALKTRPDDPQGRRDALLMGLLLDHGLRAGEIAGLSVGDLDLKAGELRFYREKVDKVQTHHLSQNALEAARAYLEKDAPPMGPLLRASRKGGQLLKPGMTSRAITARVEVLGREVGIEGLSAHDCRHYWATRAARSGTQVDRLMDAGGWASPAMPLRYVEAARIANEGVRLE